MSYRKKLIEVSIPLGAISHESAREKSLRHGHPSTLHLWWSRKPLAVCRAVLFASLVDDPAEHPEQFPTEEAQAQERKRLFALIEKMVKWENANNEETMREVRAEIAKATEGAPPPVLDPFAGGGSIPLEAMRLGLEAHASDLNPVAVLLNKALIELPSRFAGCPPVNPEARQSLIDGEWQGARGLAADIRYYGQWMRDEARRRIGQLYPKVSLPAELGGEEATVIAWLWVRTVTCPNPACGAQMPLASKWWLSKKKGKETWVEPVVDAQRRKMYFEIKGGIADKDKLREIDNGSCFINGKGKKVKASFTCLFCGSGIAKGEYIDMEADKGKMGCLPLAIVAESNQGRVYLPFDSLQIETVNNLVEIYFSSGEIQQRLPLEAARGTFASNAQGRIYGFKTFADYFTKRQLVALTTFSDLVQEVRQRVLADAQRVHSSEEEIDARAYADAIATYLALAIDRLADRNSSICSWDVSRDSTRNTFARQAIPMIWDFAEANPFSASTGNFLGAIDWVAEAIETVPCAARGGAVQRDATVSVNGLAQPLISTDPPYYDNVSYADLSDFFYVWLRRSLSTIYPQLFKTMLVPKATELVATPYRFEGSRSKAQAFFEKGLGEAFERMRAVQHPDYPLTVYYAFKQAESEDGQGEEGAALNGNGGKVVASTGWETMLEGLIRAGFTITGTLPIRTEMVNRSVGQGTNALASSIVLVCRPRPAEAGVASRRQFINALRNKLPDALKKLQQGNIAPVDLAQASIGPGMAIYSEYRQVVESDGSPLRVRAALQLINTTLDELLAEQEGEYDPATRWALAWFEQYVHEPGEYGVAETLSKAKNTSVQALVNTGWLEARMGKVRLLQRAELAANWQAQHGELPTTVWGVMQRMIHALDKGDGEAGAAAILRKAGEQGELARDLAYHLYTLCERKGWAEEALAYNALVLVWSQIGQLAHSYAPEHDVQQTSFL
ncbi:DUF1156 domain-containing protein [Ktedonosporobacter rubrisoli]|uniref:DUF1156 domain-containing protein n=1 Tax=Ktedonosporobacter rubrisoli TaxID=2509675 RepID=A0A4P6JYU2_KTERU|nr:DUF1156 domain-containing protein [Ktedonosporobacter rubrisoli]QBD80735.1 DUF1156 domain-containing protein [Ktedonosporobacter rubrisoli]